jgi:exopolysaccharide biosynthesis protein
LLDAALGVDLKHRDSRLALGELRDGRIVIALTRFEGLGGVLASLPLGLTTPEMAALMGALGARRAVALDGGISSQLLIREGTRTRTWPGWRRVPLGLLAVPRRP